MPPNTANNNNSMVTSTMMPPSSVMNTNTNTTASITGVGGSAMFPDPRQFIMGKLPVNHNSSNNNNTYNRTIKSKQQRRSFSSFGSKFTNKPPSPPLRSSKPLQKTIPKRRSSAGTSSGGAICKHKVASVVSTDPGDSSNKKKNGTNPDGDPEADKKMLEKLRDLMKSTEKTQRKLQQWDRDQGLPKSHSQTMVNTSRSRKQIQDGVILAKWDGSPLISEDVELGKARPRRTSAKVIPNASKSKFQLPNTKMMRRMSS